MPATRDMMNIDGYVQYPGRCLNSFRQNINLINVVIDKAPAPSINLIKRANITPVCAINKTYSYYVGATWHIQIRHFL